MTSTVTNKPLFVAAQHANDGKRHILLAATGSVATIKIPLIAESLVKGRDDQVSVRIVITSSATNFLGGQSKEQPTLSSLLDIPGIDGIYTDVDEWVKPWVRGDPILHIELRRWADILVIAPLSANSLAKMVNGISDGLVMSILRAWDTEGSIDGPIRLHSGPAKKTIFVAPAMNTAMWRHPVTSSQLSILERWQEDGWLRVLTPQAKALACGDVGDGAMLEWSAIVQTIQNFLELPSV